MFWFYSFCGFAILASAQPTSDAELAATSSIIKDLEHESLLGLNPKASLPIVELPYGRFQATKYVKEIDTFVFKNIRFAAPPVGPLRFSRPQPPAIETKLSKGDYGPQCVQTLATASLPQLDLAGLLNFGDRPSFMGAILDGLQPIIRDASNDNTTTSELETMLRPLIGPGGPFSLFPGSLGDLTKAISGVVGVDADEDCLFLDVYVPGKALRKPSASLPVVHWIYGGGYVFGSKDGLYDGFGLIERSRGNLIFVASNYRLGAYGFLAGRTAEQANATNLGLYDQHAAFQWTQDYIGMFGGDKTRVTAMGESAGAGSIMHQLVAFGGTQDPLFRKAIIQSPAFQPAINRDGTLEDNFKKFEAEAGCAGKGFACLTTVGKEKIAKASETVTKSAPPGTFGFGPSADGAFVRQSPGLEFYTGNFFKDMESLVISHTSNESYQFVSPDIQTQQQLAQFEQMLVPSNQSIQTALNAHFQEFPTVSTRVADLVQGTSFTCNVRYMTQNYPGKTFNIQYSKGRGAHGSDITTTFFSKFNPITSLVGIINPDVARLGPRLQSYFSSYIMSGDPNQFRSILTPPLSKLTDPNAQLLSPVLNFDDSITNIQDPATKLSDCNFWKDIGAGATNVLGYAPPGSVANSSISATEPSQFYSGTTRPPFSVNGAQTSAADAPGVRGFAILLHLIVCLVFVV